LNSIKATDRDKFSNVILALLLRFDSASKTLRTHHHTRLRWCYWGWIELDMCVVIALTGIIINYFSSW